MDEALIGGPGLELVQVVTPQWTATGILLRRTLLGEGFVEIPGREARWFPRDWIRHGNPEEHQ